ncbi:hypothetical protein [Peribacillus butanolivorans]|uniref:hypothetical protein n=1 Tax=Peribacillus butanolivorans TaxID=421767 RepID=UPI0035E075E1
MESGILYRDDIESLTEKLGLILINGEIDINSETSNQIEITDQKEFIDFHQHVENKILFYSYTYVNQEHFIIPDDFHEGYEETIQEQLIEEFQKYNQSVMKIDFEKPAALFMYYIKEGFLFFNYSDREEIAELPTNKDMAIIIVGEVVEQLPEEKVKEITEKAQADKDKKEQELKEIIFSDPEFKIATNDKLRKAYTGIFFENRPEAREFLRYAGYIHPVFFIEKIWKEFKEKGLNK